MPIFHNNNNKNHQHNPGSSSVPPRVVTEKPKLKSKSGSKSHVLSSVSFDVFQPFYFFSLLLLSLRKPQSGPWYLRILLRTVSKVRKETAYLLNDKKYRGGRKGIVVF